MSSDQAGASIDELLQGAGTVTSAPGWSALPVPAIEAITAAPLPPGATPGALPRGVYVHDGVMDSWNFVEDSGDLSLNWELDLVSYQLLVDWDANSPTMLVSDQFDSQFEVPTGAEATFSRAGMVQGVLELGSGWTANQCGYDEPTSASASGYLGDDDAKLELSRLALSRSETAGSDTLTVGFGAGATVGADSVAVYLDLNANGQLIRSADCVINDFTVQSGSVTTGFSTRVAGEDRSLTFHGDFSNVMVDSGTLTGVDLDGYLRLNDSLAMAFSGTLNDANANGVPGDELQLSFAGNELLTLEEFLIEQIGFVPLTALRMMLR